MMKIPNWILSLFGRAITKCDFCPSNFRGSLQEGRFWLAAIHIPNCPEFKRWIKEVRVD